MPSLGHRQLSRDSSHRKALLRNLVTALMERETITTTWAKAKETQRMAEKLITHAKKNTNASKVRAEDYVHQPHRILPKVFSVLRNRYLARPGGYTRLLLAEPHKSDQARSAILSLVDGPKDIRFAMTAKVLAHERAKGLTSMPEMTAYAVRKATRFRGENGEQELEAEIKRLEEERMRVEGIEKEGFEEEGSTWEWVEDSGPGKVVKKRVEIDDLDQRERMKLKDERALTRNQPSLG